jgi:UDP-glucose 4-epimerase
VSGSPRARALVTGAAGFVGSHLAEALAAAGRDVVGIDSFSDTYPAAVKERNLARLSASPGFRLVRGDLVDLPLAPLLDGVGAVYHLAARAGVRASWGAEFDRYTHDNLLATQRLLEAARDLRLERFVYASSSSVYGDARELPVTEEAPTEPVSPYGATKLTAEHLGRIYHRSYGVPFVSLRLFTVYGPRQRPDMAFHRFVRAVAAGEPVEVYGDGAQTRDFTYVGDAVAAFVAAGAAEGVVGEVINVGGGVRIALRDAIEMIGEIAGRAPRVSTRPKARGDAAHTLASIRKAERLLGYRPATPLVEGLREELRWVREQAGFSAGR